MLTGPQEPCNRCREAGYRCWVEHKRKACFACIEVKQKCSFINRGGAAGTVSDAALSGLGAELCHALDTVDDTVNDLRHAVLLAGLWGSRATLHQANIMAMQLQWSVVEAESRGVEVPSGFKLDVDRGVTRTECLQLSTAAEYADAAGASVDAVNSTMGIIADRWVVPSRPRKRARSDEEEENPEPAGKRKKGKKGSGEEEKGEETLGK